MYWNYSYLLSPMYPLPPFHSSLCSLPSRTLLQLFIPFLFFLSHLHSLFLPSLLPVYYHSLFPPLPSTPPLPPLFPSLPLTSPLCLPGLYTRGLPELTGIVCRLLFRPHPPQQPKPGREGSRKVSYHNGQVLLSVSVIR